jgi:hypothetical protein
MQTSKNPDYVVRVIDCPNCAHCVDLRTPSFNDADALKKARDEQFLTISDWVAEYWRELQRKNIEMVLLK